MQHGLFVRAIEQCVRAELVDGKKLHVDSSLIDADACRESVVNGAPELIAALKRTHQRRKASWRRQAEHAITAVNGWMMSQSDLNAGC